jgi:hypothetical protein
MPGRYANDDNATASFMDIVPNPFLGALCSNYCAPGRYHTKDHRGETSDKNCLPCAAGTYCPCDDFSWEIYGSQLWPFECPKNEYCEEESYNGKTCDGGHEIDPDLRTGGKSEEDCKKCEAGKVAKVGSLGCSFCPAGTQAPRDSSSIRDVCYVCPNPAACLAENQCAAGHTGALCGSCVPKE